MPKIRFVSNSDNNQKLGTIKIFKTHLDIGLRQAKDIVDQLYSLNIKSNKKFGNVVEYMDHYGRVNIMNLQEELNVTGHNITINIDKQSERQNKLLVLTDNGDKKQYIDNIKELFEITTNDISYILSDLSKSDLMKIHKKLWHLYLDTYKKNND